MDPNAPFPTATTHDHRTASTAPADSHHAAPLTNLSHEPTELYHPNHDDQHAEDDAEDDEDDDEDEDQDDDDDDWLLSSGDELVDGRLNPRASTRHRDSVATSLVDDDEDRRSDLSSSASAASHILAPLALPAHSIPGARRPTNGPLWTVPLQAGHESGSSEAQSSAVAAAAAAAAAANASAARQRMPLRARQPTMGERDLNKMEAQFEDAGYREGITAGKMSTLQAGFDEGFSTVGAPLGRAVGRLRGETTSLFAYVARLAADAQISLAPPAAPSPAPGSMYAQSGSHSQQQQQQQQHIEVQYEGEGGGMGSAAGETAPRDGAGMMGRASGAEAALDDFLAQEDILPGPGRARVRLRGRVGASGINASGSNISATGGMITPSASSRRLNAAGAAGSQSQQQQQQQQQRSRAAGLGHSGANSKHAHLKASDILALLCESHALLQEAQNLSLERLAPPDNEALAHEREHVLAMAEDDDAGNAEQETGAEMEAEAGAGVGVGVGVGRDGKREMSPQAYARANAAAARAWRPESDEERARREAILPTLYARLHAAKAVLGLVS
ncbi:hypothetical protein OC844_003055 [Tilletia horrida]|nr:hypothetical protein OC844_003055 [Tilletia horrida]